MKQLKLSVVIGTRPELIKMSPILRRLAAMPECEFQFIDTGQHYDYEMDLVFCEELQLPKPVFLDVGSATPGKQTGKAMIAIEEQMIIFQPDVVIVAGDTNSTLSGALVASKLNIPIAHVEAGLRSFDRSMPEEINRVIVDHIAHWLFAPTQVAIDNLVAEGIAREKITLTYDIHVDVLNDNFKIADEKSTIVDELNLDKYVLVTCHRQGNTDDPLKLSRIVDGLIEAAHDISIVFPVHPRTDKKLREFNLHKRLSETAGVKLIKPVGFFDFLKLMGHATCIITDSGGVQKEAIILKIPCITIRENTEWTETVELGANKLVGTDTARLVAAINERTTAKFGQWMQSVPNPYGAGQTTSIILEQILNDLEIWARPAKVRVLN